MDTLLKELQTISWDKILLTSFGTIFLILLLAWLGHCSLLRSCSENLEQRLVRTKPELG